MLAFPSNTFSDSDRPASEVHRARSKRTGALVALKKIIMHNEKDGVRSLSGSSSLARTCLTLSQFPITALREIKLLKLLSHNNVLRLEDMAVEHPSRSSKASPHQDPSCWNSLTCLLSSRQAEKADHVHG